MFKDLFRGLPESMEKAFEQQLEDALRAADNLHRDSVQYHDLECMKICAKIHAVLDSIRKFRISLEEQEE